jgi:uncharacterized protein (TIGR03435 family)
MRRLLCTLFLAAAFCPAQQFEVASIKPSNSATRELTLQFTGDGLMARNVPVGMLVMRAFRLDESQFQRPTPALFRLPYDVVAKAGHPAARAEIERMLQTLLADRFHLSLRRETREVSGYVLVVASSGPKLKRHEGGEPGNCRTRLESDGRFRYENCTPAELASFSLYPGMMGISGRLGNRFIADETGLPGTYDFDLFYSWEVPANPAEGRPEPRTINPGAPSLFSALQDQLGLKLEPRRIPVEFVRVERLEKPSEN